MNIQCSTCSTVLRIDESKYNQGVIIVQCPKCSQKIRVQLQASKKLDNNESEIRISNEIIQKKDFAIFEANRVDKLKEQRQSNLIGVLIILFLLCFCYAAFS
jgi:predicted Zn finger-like uncharacterized protein